jgi:hypothetical protein
MNVKLCCSKGLVQSSLLSPSSGYELYSSQYNIRKLSETAQAMWIGYGFGQGKSDGLLATVYPVIDDSSSKMMYSHICDMTAASAL